MRRQLVTGLVMTVVLTVMLGIVYPFAVFAIGQVAFHDRANGSYVTASDGKVVGSSLIGQAFTDATGTPLVQYFQPRPSAAGKGYDAQASSASNLGPGNPKLIAPAEGPDCFLTDTTDDKGDAVLDAAGKAVQECSTDTVPGRAAAYRKLNGLADDVLVPVDAVTSSGSGLDPHISVANATLQVARVAAARGVSPQVVVDAIGRHTTDRAWGFLGEKVVNVLTLNLDLDRRG